MRGLLVTWRTAECRQNKNTPKSKVTKCTFYRNRSNCHVCYFC